MRGTTALYPEPELVDFGEGKTKEKIQVFNGRTPVFMTLAVATSAKRRVGSKSASQLPGLRQFKCLFPIELTNMVTPECSNHPFGRQRPTANCSRP